MVVRSSKASVRTDLEKDNSTDNNPTNLSNHAEDHPLLHGDALVGEGCRLETCHHGVAVLAPVTEDGGGRGEAEDEDEERSESGAGHDERLDRTKRLTTDNRAVMEYVEIGHESDRVKFYRLMENKEKLLTTCHIWGILILSHYFGGCFYDFFEVSEVRQLSTFVSLL